MIFFIFTLLLLALLAPPLSFFLIQKLKLLPKLSSSEKEAVLTGQTFIEKEFFKGLFKVKNLFYFKKARLTSEEESFLSNQTEKLGEIAQEWEHMKSKKLSEEVWSFLKEEKFFGIVVPKEYGGLGFSHLAHGRIIEKIASFNLPLSVITMVPNSLGPAKLLLQYGTKEQKKEHLRKLALGSSIPCFGLTEVNAGSDASAIQSEGILFKEDGVLKIRMNFSKRWITLSYKSSLIGVALKLKDPENLLSKKKDLGITCVLVPSSTPGLIKEGLHDPMGVPIFNAPIRGENVVLEAEKAIIGGIKEAGNGWSMLMKCLTMGRGISLPALSVGIGKRSLWQTATHSVVRKQFGMSISKFEGVREALALMIGKLHMMNSLQNYSLSAMDQGRISSSFTALSKYHLTEMARDIIIKAMDIMGGQGLSLGPKNKIAFAYILMPVAITVEGANILTRTFISYGQGLMKSHKYVFKLFSSLEEKKILKFCLTIYAFLFQFTRNFIFMILFNLSKGFLVFWKSPFKKGRFLQKLIWSSTIFSFLSDLSFLFIGPDLKKRGSFNGKMADILSYLSTASALIWSFNEDKSKKEEWIFYSWGLQFCFSQIDKNISDILRNHPSFFVRHFLKFLFLRLPIASPPSDKLSFQMTKLFLEKEDLKDKMCENLYFPKEEQDTFFKMRKAFRLTLKEEEILKKLRKKGRRLSVDQALKENILSQEEAQILEQTKKARFEATQVDVFPEDQYYP